MAKTKKVIKKSAAWKKVQKTASVSGALTGILNAYLHPQETSDPYWRWLPHLLVVAFVLRALAALAGDFVIHPDEIMQYLEPAHKLVFGGGVVYWEYFYGARSWLVPGLVVSVLWLCKLLGLDSPTYYVAAVKLVFCLIAVLVPWGMYVFSRRHWGEKTARVALLLGVFWYELVGFAHKPMTEFVATSLIFALLAACPMTKINLRRALLVGMLGMLIVAVRFHYLFVVGLILLASFGMADKRARLAMVGGSVVMLLGVAVLEFFTWGGIFHSYYLNYKMNVIVGAGRAGESNPLYFLTWLFIASGGLAVVVLPATMRLKRRGFVLALIMLVLLPHMLQNHREYRFIFVVIPLWLLLLANGIAAATGLKNTVEKILWPAAAMGYALFISVLGILNYIPLQKNVYTGFSRESGNVNFIANHDPMFGLYRELADDDSVRGLLDSTRPYFNTGGYYYLNRNIPFYDALSWRDFFKPEESAVYVSHIISAGPVAPIKTDVDGQGASFLETDNGNIRLPAFVFNKKTRQLTHWDARGREIVLADYELSRQIGETSLWKSNRAAAVREWVRPIPMPVGGLEGVMRRIFGDSVPKTPLRYGIEFKNDSG